MEVGPLVIGHDEYIWLQKQRLENCRKYYPHSLPLFLCCSFSHFSICLKKMIGDTDRKFATIFSSLFLKSNIFIMNCHCFFWGDCLALCRRFCCLSFRYRGFPCCRIRHCFVLVVKFVVIFVVVIASSSSLRRRGRQRCRCCCCCCFCWYVLFRSRNFVFTL